MNNRKSTRFSNLAILFSLFVLTLIQSPVHADETENWLGTLDVKVAKLRIQLELKLDADGNYSGDMISLDQGGGRIKLDRVVRTNDNLEFEIKKLATKYTGSMNDDQTIATGKYTQGQVFDLVFKRVAEVKPDKHIQSWKGTLKAGGQSFDFQFRVFEGGDGAHFAKLDSFSEKLTGIQCELDINENEVTFNIPATRAKLAGRLSADKKKIEGNWIQGGGKFPITLDKIPLEQTRVLNLNRPQTPKPPYDYDVSDFVVNVKELDPSYEEAFELAGTLTMPNGSGPFASVILINGSGPHDRDNTVFGHKSFLVLADHLTKNGYAVIRFDERGVAKSTGDFATATTADLAQDVETLFRWAKTQPKLDPKKVVLIGHSEGGLIAPIVASRAKDVAGIVLLGGPGVPGYKLSLNQARKIMAATGLSEDVLDAQENLNRKMYDRLRAGKPFDDEFKKTIDEDFRKLSEKMGQTFEMESSVSEAAFAEMSSPWIRYFLLYDPKDALSKTACPILSLIGENDIQVDAALNMPAIEAAVKSGGNQDFVQKELPKLNHLFQRSETGMLNEYIKIEQTLDPSVLNEITNWLKKRF